MSSQAGQYRRCGRVSTSLVYRLHLPHLVGGWGEGGRGRIRWGRVEVGAEKGRVEVGAEKGRVEVGVEKGRVEVGAEKGRVEVGVEKGRVEVGASVRKSVD